jgi:hypothetical protein
MRKEEVVPVFEAALKPMLTAAGFERQGDRWISRRGDAIRSVEFGPSFKGAVLRAGIGFMPALDLLKTAPPELDWKYNTIPASDLLQLYLYRGVRDSCPAGKVQSGLFWQLADLTAAALAESAEENFRSHVLPFFERTSTVEAALGEVRDEGRYGDCGPMSRFEPRINKFFLAALYQQRGDEGEAMEVIQKELAIVHPDQPCPAFRDWILRP